MVVSDFGCLWVVGCGLVNSVALDISLLCCLLSFGGLYLIAV